MMKKIDFLIQKKNILYIMNNQIKKKHIDLEAPFNKESYHR